MPKIKHKDLSVIITLGNIRKHVRQHAWNGTDFTSKDSARQVFFGQCEYASTAISEMLTGTGKRIGSVDWSLRRRGWYKGVVTEDANWECSAEGWIAHSWVVVNGQIVDPTWWAFEGLEPKIYVFDANDPRYVENENA